MTSEFQGASLRAPAHVDVALHAFGESNAVARRTDFWDASYEWRRLFSELLGTFLLVTALSAPAW